MNNIANFLQGKKTYISAAALLLVAVAGWWFGAISETDALALLCVAGVAVGLGAKSERYGRLVLTSLEDVKARAQPGKPLDVKAVAIEISRQVGPQVVSEIIAAAEKGEASAANASASITVSAPPGHVPFIPTPEEEARHRTNPK